MGDVTTDRLAGYTDRAMVPTRSVFIALAACVCLACRNAAGDPDPQPFPDCGAGLLSEGPPATGVYAYAACDSAGQLLLLGQLTLSVAPSGSVEGSWHIDWVPGADRSTEVGPQVGGGTLAGSVHGTQVTLTLNPGWADNNVLLTGTWGSGGGGGSWSYVAFTGPRAAGPFAASRR